MNWVASREPDKWKRCLRLRLRLRLRFYVKRTNHDISKTALPITETKKRKHFAIQSTPQNLGKLTSETTFGHSKVVFWPLLRTKRTFSQNPPMARFWNFFGDTWHLFHTKKLDGSDWEFFFLSPRSRPMCIIFKIASIALKVFLQKASHKMLSCSFSEKLGNKPLTHKLAHPTQSFCDPIMGQ